MSHGSDDAGASASLQSHVKKNGSDGEDREVERKPQCFHDSSSQMDYSREPAVECTRDSVKYTPPIMSHEVRSDDMAPSIQNKDMFITDDAIIISDDEENHRIPTPDIDLSHSDLDDLPSINVSESEGDKLDDSEQPIVIESVTGASAVNGRHSDAACEDQGSPGDQLGHDVAPTVSGESGATTGSVDSDPVQNSQCQSAESPYLREKNTADDSRSPLKKIPECAGEKH